MSPYMVQLFYAEWGTSIVLPKPIFQHLQIYFPVAVAYMPTPTTQLVTHQMVRMQVSAGGGPFLPNPRVPSILLKDNHYSLKENLSGAEYSDILYNSVRRNLTERSFHRSFGCTQPLSTVVPGLPEHEDTPSPGVCAHN